MMSGIRNNLPSITSSSLQLLEQAQSKVQSVSEKLSSAQPMLDSSQNPPTQITSTRPLNSEIEISPKSDIRFDNSKFISPPHKILHSGRGEIILSTSVNVIIRSEAS